MKTVIRLKDSNKPIYEILNEVVNENHLKDGDYFTKTSKNTYKFGVRNNELEYIILNDVFILMDKEEVRYNK